MGDVVKFSAPVHDPSAKDHVALRALMKYMSSVLGIPYKSFASQKFSENQVKSYTNDRTNRNEPSRQMFRAFSSKSADILASKRQDLQLDDFVLHILRHLQGDNWLTSNGFEPTATVPAAQSPDQALTNWLGISEEKIRYIERRYCGLWRVFRMSSPPAIPDPQARPERPEINYSLLNIRSRSVKNGALCDFRWHYLGWRHEWDEFRTIEGWVVPNVDRIEFVGRPDSPILSLMVWGYTFNPELVSHAEVTRGMSLSLNTALEPVSARVRSFFLNNTDKLTGDEFNAKREEELKAIGVHSIETMRNLIPANQFEETQRFLQQFKPIVGISPSPDDTGDR
jgi:hypothetical protein